jgi:indole-3-glycerol phosphate synthase
VSVLDRICDAKRSEIERRKAARPLASLEARLPEAPPLRGFAKALDAAVAAGRAGLIAEIKRASPSKGLIRADFDPAALARAYERGGAVCLSVLTDEPYFQGADAHLVAARGAVRLPVLRKDFTLDAYQLVEARLMGADCVLLIMAALDDNMALSLAEAARRLGLDVLVEVHDEEELRRASSLPCQLLGINNRNLKTLTVDLSTTRRLAALISHMPLTPHAPLLVAESGIRTSADIAELSRAGAHCFLVGEQLMSEPDLEAATRALLAPAPLQASA